jgi:hypothetical protein
MPEGTKILRAEPAMTPQIFGAGRATAIVHGQASGRKSMFQTEQRDRPCLAVEQRKMSTRKTTLPSSYHVAMRHEFIGGEG